MKNRIWLLVLAAALLLSACAAPQEAPQTAAPQPEPTEAGPALLFEDEFEGTELDGSKWKRCPEWKRQDASWWKDENSYLDGEGHLVLEITPSAVSGTVDCGAVRTAGIFEQTYGYYEASIRFPELKGTWGAFWLMGEGVHNEDGSGEDGTEIDIIESINNELGKSNSALHWDGYEAAHRSDSATYRENIYDGEFHKFALLWTQKEYVFFIDDEEVWRTDAGGVCKEPLYMKLSTESATWAGTVDPEKMPARMEVDYVRVWESKP